jgi:hypothetical protein
VTLELRRGEKADILISGLLDPIGAPAVFAVGDTILFTAKADLGHADSEALLAKTTADGGITIALGGATATVHVLAADWVDVRLNADQSFHWDLELLPAGVAADRVTLASGDGVVIADVGGNPVSTVPKPGGMTCSPWATDADAVAPCNTGVDTDELNLCMQFASDVLYQFTRRKYRGICVDEVFPNAQWRSFEGPRSWWPEMGNAGYSRWGWCSCHRTEEYGCSRIPQIVLPGFPVIEDGIVVTIEGQTFTGWELRDRRKLVRTDGDGWPCCQPLPLDASADNGWSIRYPWGVNPPAAGKRCAAILGCQLYNAFNPGDGRTCQLPQRVTNIARQSVTIGAILDPLELFDKGKTGLATVDMWIASDRYGDRQSSAVIVPGRGRRATRTR